MKRFGRAGCRSRKRGMRWGGQRESVRQQWRKGARRPGNRNSEKQNGLENDSAKACVGKFSGMTC